VATFAPHGAAGALNCRRRHYCFDAAAACLPLLSSIVGLYLAEQQATFA